MLITSTTELQIPSRANLNLKQTASQFNKSVRFPGSNDSSRIQENLFKAIIPKAKLRHLLGCDNIYVYNAAIFVCM